MNAMERQPMQPMQYPPAAGIGLHSCFRALGVRCNFLASGSSCPLLLSLASTDHAFLPSLVSERCPISKSRCVNTCLSGEGCAGDCSHSNGKKSRRMQSLRCMPVCRAPVLCPFQASQRGHRGVTAPRGAHHAHGMTSNHTCPDVLKTWRASHAGKGHDTWG